MIHAERSGIEQKEVDSIGVFAEPEHPWSLPGLATEDRVVRAGGSRWTPKLSLVLLALFLLAAVNSAWICDDAYIGFRVADNFAHGYGLTWNVAERVQVYTCPLWVLAVSLVNVVTREVYFTSMVLSLAMSTAAVGLLVRRHATSPLNASLVVFAAVSSKAFMDYTTSGLENSLGYLLAAGFYVSLFSGVSTFRLSLLGSMLVLNRADNVLLIAPPLLFTLAWRTRWRDLAAMALGVLPFLLWECFALFYYGSLVPNTAYAKLNTGIPRGELVEQGLWYFADSLCRDPVTLLLTVLAIVMADVAKDGRSKSIAVGMALYISYIAWIGGDFMSGRFFSLPFMGALSLLAFHPLSSRVAGGVGLATLTLGVVMPCSPLRSGADYGGDDRRSIRAYHGVADERACYYPSTGLLNAGLEMTRPFHPWAYVGESARRGGRAVIGRGNIGFLGYFAGPSVYIVDPGALADALLARLPLAPSTWWRIGHFKRQIPDGYFQTLVSGENKITNPSIARFYERLRLVISGPLWSRERLLEVVRLVTGVYRLPEVAQEARRSVSARSLLQEVAFSSSGIEVELGGVYHSGELRILLDNNDTYRVVFLHGLRPVGEQKVAPDSEPITIDMTLYHVTVPTRAAREGFDRIRVQPLDGDRYYAIGGVSWSEYGVRTTGDTGVRLDEGPFP